ncbi:MAG TPA: redoxin domain-containing protein [Gemmatimonadaceae bacterium]|nr:redoxin domain-containing protein [Gemmatimonadaceae bacterium]
MSLSINAPAPDFSADTTQGRISFHEWLGDSWGILFSHPKDFTPVCTTELGYLAAIKPEFEKRGVKLIGLSVDPVEQHVLWSKDIEETQGAAVTFPMIGDPTLAISKLYQMLPDSAGETSEGRTAADNQTVRVVYVIGPDKKIRLTIAYPMATGRNFDELLRVVDSLQLTAQKRVATPAQWQPGDDVIILPAVSNDEAKTLFPNGWRAPKPYIRIVPQPANGRVRYRKEGITTFDAPTEKLYRYMQVGNHQHQAFKSHNLVSIDGDVVTLAVEVYHPDGTTGEMTVKHTLDAPRGVQTEMIGGMFSGARFTHTYTEQNNRTRVDLEGEFPALPGMTVAEELKMIDGFFTTIFAEDTATLRTWN